MGNGVALSPDGKTLWITEYRRDLLDRIQLKDATSIALFGSGMAYHFTGPAPDSMRADADGNLYVAIYGKSRVIVFNKNGIPIGQVFLPGHRKCVYTAVIPHYDLDSQRRGLQYHQGLAIRG